MITREPILENQMVDPALVVYYSKQVYDRSAAICVLKISVLTFFTCTCYVGWEHREYGVSRVLCVS